MSSRGEVETVRGLLEQYGVSDADIDAAAEEGTLVLLAIERLVFEHEPRMTTEQMLAVTPLDPVRTTELWRSLGFPDPPVDEVFFTDADVEILGVLAGLIDTGATDPELLVQITRVAGQAMARFAAAQVELLMQRSADLTEAIAMQVAAERADGHDDEAEAETWKPSQDAATLELPAIDAPDVATDLDEVPEVDPEVRRRVAAVLLDDPTTLASVMVVEAVPRLLEYVWQRHMQAGARNRLLHGGPETSTTLAVGFADLVGFTSLAQQISATDLAEVLDRFERIAYDIVAGLGGRVIKMIGDEVMFSVDDPRRAVEVGMRLAATYRDDDELSDVRVGLSWGPVLQREGDCFGPVVNRASRVVNIAFPGSVVVSDELHELIADDPELHWRSLRKKNLRDIGRVTLWSVEPAGTDDHDAAVRDRARAERSERVERAVEKLNRGELLSKEERQARRDALREARRDAEERARKARKEIEERTREALKRVEEQAKRARKEVEERSREAKRELDERTEREIAEHSDPND
ncbi:MAG TPA: adenylate/guanylate cyclase domain-containing protein [Acidimicrobiales bacterium]|nr:adenylate/guanylate cyclase domain-containing protein [Acidimicrobiales bacterium]